MSMKTYRATLDELDCLELCHGATDCAKVARTRPPKTLGIARDREQSREELHERRGFALRPRNGVYADDDVRYKTKVGGNLAHDVSV